MKERYFMSNVIIGTAGHIDHGKTTLIKALSGIETDTIAPTRGTDEALRDARRAL